MLGKLLYNNPTVKIDIKGNESLEGYKKIYSKLDYPAFLKTDNIHGHLRVEPPPGKVDSHRGITLTVYGQYVTKTGEFLSRFFERAQHLAPIGDLATPIDTDFSFDNLDFPVSSYYGQTINAEYGIELKVMHRLSDFKYTLPFLVFLFHPTSVQEPIHNEIGMTNVLHIEFVFPQADFDCREVVIGAAFFILVKLRIVNMNVSLYCVETYENGAKFIRERTIVDTSELMDGAPVKGDNIPIRYFLGPFDIWPYIAWKGSPLKVDYYLRSQMIDENGKKYYKRLKVNIVRKCPEELSSQTQVSLEEDENEEKA